MGWVVAPFMVVVAEEVPHLYLCQAQAHRSLWQVQICMPYGPESPDRTGGFKLFYSNLIQTSSRVVLQTKYRKCVVGGGGGDSVSGAGGNSGTTCTSTTVAAAGGNGGAGSSSPGNGTRGSPGAGGGHLPTLLQ